MGLELRDLAGVVELCRKRGARGAEALLQDATGASLDVQRGKVVRRQDEAWSRIDVRVWLEGGAAGQATGSPDAWESLVEHALAAASIAEPDALAGPVGRLGGGDTRGLGIDDRRYEMVEWTDRIEVAVTAEQGARSLDPRVWTEGFGYRDERLRRMFANSRGVMFEERGTTYGCTGTVKLAETDPMVKLSGSIDGRAFASISSLPYGAILARRALDLLGPPSELSGPVRVVLPARVVAALVAHLARAFTPEGLAATVLGTQGADRPLLDPKLHVLDDGLLPGALRTRGFDDRGVPPVPLTLIREGWVHQRFLDPRAARTGETRPTGHVRGEHQSPSNLVVRPGTRSVNALTTDMDDPILYVDDIDDLPAAFDIVNARIDGICSGQVLRRGKLEGTVFRRHITGELLDVLNRFVEVSSDTDRIGNVDAPAIVIDGFSLA